MPSLGKYGNTYPTIEEVFNSTRVFLNDTEAGITGTVGEGRIFTDEWTPSLTTLNLATQALQRDLENLGYKTTTEETFYTSLPPVNGVGGCGIPDPTVQEYLDWNGFWDGSVLHGDPPSPANPNGDPALPLDFILPIRIQERQAGSGVNFTDIEEADDGLPSIYQTNSLGQWEWRGDAIYLNGSVMKMDIRVRYRATILPKFPLTLQPESFSQVYVPFADSGDCLAYRCAYIFSSARLPDNASNSLLAGYQDAMNKIANRQTRARQRKRFSRDSYGEQGSPFGWGPG